MEQKSTTSNRTKNLLMQNIKEKKHWALLTLVVLLVTVVVLPMMMEQDISEEFIALGIFEVFVVIFINCLIDLNYLHDSRKFGYYLSKPFGLEKKLNTVLLANGLFAFVFLSGLFLVSAVMGLYLDDLFIIPVSWMIYMIFVIGLASHISGNTIIAGILSLFIYGLPVLILGVIYYATSFVGDLAAGLNVNVIMDYILGNIYRLDVIYLIKYLDSFSIGYFVVLLLVSVILYSLTRWVIKHRRNERIGEFIMFRGFKYFVAVIISVMVPFMFSSILSNSNILAMVLSFIILGGLTYYVALVVLDKSFRIRPKAIKVLVVFMSIFLVIVLVSGVMVTNIQGKTPDIDKIKGVYISTSSYVYLPDKNNSNINIRHLEYDDIEKYDLPIYTSKEAKEIIIDLHKSIVEGHSFNHYIDINIIYFMENGARIKRFFSLEYYGNGEGSEIEKNIKKLMKTEDNKFIRFPLFYDSAYRSHFNDLETSVYTDQMDIELTTRQTDELIRVIREDLDLYIGKYDNDVYSIGYNSSYVSFPYIEISKESKGYSDYISVGFSNENRHFQSYDIPQYFENTRIYVQKLIDDNNY